MDACDGNAQAVDGVFVRRSPQERADQAANSTAVLWHRRIFGQCGQCHGRAGVEHGCVVAVNHRDRHMSVGAQPHTVGGAHHDAVGRFGLEVGRRLEGHGPGCAVDIEQRRIAAMQRVAHTHIAIGLRVVDHHRGVGVFLHAGRCARCKHRCQRVHTVRGVVGHGQVAQVGEVVGGVADGATIELHAVSAHAHAIGVVGTRDHGVAEGQCLCAGAR